MNIDDYIKQFSNGRYDMNIDTLYQQYVESKREYVKKVDETHKEDVMWHLGRIMAELYDLIETMRNNADCEAEQDIINRYLKMIANM